MASKPCWCNQQFFAGPPASTWGRVYDSTQSHFGRHHHCGAKASCVLSRSEFVNFVMPWFVMIRVDEACAARGRNEYLSCSTESSSAPTQQLSTTVVFCSCFFFCTGGALLFRSPFCFATIVLSKSGVGSSRLEFASFGSHTK